MIDHNKIFSTYIDKRYTVQTSYRQSSAIMNDAPWYWEHMIFDRRAKDGGILYQSSSSGEKQAMRKHFRLVWAWYRKAIESPAEADSASD